MCWPWVKHDATGIQVPSPSHTCHVGIALRRLAGNVVGRLGPVPALLFCDGQTPTAPRPSWTTAHPDSIRLSFPVSSAALPCRTGDEEQLEVATKTCDGVVSYGQVVETILIPDSFM